MYYSSALSLVLFLFTQSIGAVDWAETSDFPASPGDILDVRLDYGRVSVRTWEQDRVSAQIKRVAQNAAGLENIQVLTVKSQHYLFFHALFFDYISESATLEFTVPAYMNVNIFGANPEVQVQGLKGFLRVQTTTGRVVSKDLTSSTSIITDSGDIVYKAKDTGFSDTHLQTASGRVSCYIAPEVSFRAWLRAGGTLSWNDKVSLNRGSLEKQVGQSGPLLFASSLNGDVTVRLVSAGAVPNANDEGLPTGIQEPGSDDSAARPSSNSDPGSGSNASVVPDLDRAPVLADGHPQKGAQSPTGTYSISVAVDWVHLDVSVRDRNNRSVAGLQKEDFLLFEEGLEQRVEKLESSEAPISLLLLLDVSGSTKSHMDLIRRASIQFTQGLRRQDRIAVASFNSRVRLIQDFTSDRSRVAQAIRRLRSHGGTAFYDALDTALDTMNGVEGRKAIVVFTDGVDNQLTGDWTHGSQTHYEELFREVEESDPIIYPIFLDTSEESGRGGGSISIGILGDIMRGRIPGTRPDAYRVARGQLRQIADQTGGRLYEPRRIQDLSHAYSEIANDLRVQYRLAYNSSNPARDGSWRRIDIKMADQRLTARTRRGYYAPRD